MKNNLHLLFLIAVIVFFYSACVKDTDFDQTDDIVLETVLELDFIFFDINSQNFTDLGVNNTIISDTTNLDFLGSEAASENIISNLFHLTLIGDLVSVYMAENLNIDPYDITAIEKLKKLLKG